MKLSSGDSFPEISFVRNFQSSEKKDQSSKSEERKTRGVSFKEERGEVREPGG